MKKLKYVMLPILVFGLLFVSYELGRFVEAYNQQTFINQIEQLNSINTILVK